MFGGAVVWSANGTDCDHELLRGMLLCAARLEMRVYIPSMDRLRRSGRDKAAREPAEPSVNVFMI